MPDKKPEYRPIRDNNRIERHPEEDLRFKVNMGDQSIRDIDWEIHYRERKFAANNSNLDKKPEGSWDSKNDAGYFTISKSYNELKVKIPADDLPNWKRSSFYLSLIADDGDDRWEVDTFTVTSIVRA